MAIGTVKWFNHSKGFGFIVTEEGEDLFVHVTNVIERDRGDIYNGAKVSYRNGLGRKGSQAKDVELIIPPANRDQRVKAAREYGVPYNNDGTVTMEDIHKSGYVEFRGEEGKTVKSVVTTDSGKKYWLKSYESIHRENFMYHIKAHSHSRYEYDRMLYSYNCKNNLCSHVYHTTGGRRYRRDNTLWGERSHFSDDGFFG